MTCTSAQLGPCARPAGGSPNETLPSGHGRHPSATSRDPSQAHWLGRLPEIRGFVGRCGGQWRCHGKSPAAQASPVLRCVIAVVDQLAARGALRRRILVVVALVSESGVVEALRIRRGFPDAGKKGIRVLASTIARSHLRSMDVDPVASSRRTASTAIARGIPCQRREVAIRAATSCSARATQSVHTATMSRNTIVRCGS